MNEAAESRESLPDIPAKRYFTIGEVAELCGVKPYVLRYWEQEFSQLKPMKRRGNRRYYQHHEVLLIRRIRDLLYDQGFTISGARNQLQGSVEPVPSEVELIVVSEREALPTVLPDTQTDLRSTVLSMDDCPEKSANLGGSMRLSSEDLKNLRGELISIRNLLRDG